MPRGKKAVIAGGVTGVLIHRKIKKHRKKKKLKKLKKKYRKGKYYYIWEEGQYLEIFKTSVKKFWTMSDNQ